MIENPQAKRPAPHTGWVELEHVQVKELTLIPWQNGKICVVSTLDMAELPRQNGLIGPQWHISISQAASPQNKRPTFEQVRKALRAFRMVGAEEDNHHPGNARHFFMPVDPASRSACECKEDEEQVMERDGYVWSNPKTPLGGSYQHDDPEIAGFVTRALGEICRGCAIAPLTGRPCSLHAGDKAAEPR